MVKSDVKIDFRAGSVRLDGFYEPFRGVFNAAILRF